MSTYLNFKDNCDSVDNFEEHVSDEHAYWEVKEVINEVPDTSVTRTSYPLEFHRKRYVKEMRKERWGELLPCIKQENLPCPCFSRQKLFDFKFQNESNDLPMSDPIEITARDN